MSPNPFVRINERGDKGEIREVNGRRLLRMYREYV